MLISSDPWYLRRYCGGCIDFGVFRCWVMVSNEGKRWPGKRRQNFPEFSSAGYSSLQNLPAAPPFQSSSFFSHFNNILELVQGATYLLNMSPWEHLSWQRYNEDIGPPRQGTTIWISWYHGYRSIKSSNMFPGVYTHHVQEEELQHSKRRRRGLPRTRKKSQWWRGRRRRQRHLRAVRRLSFHQVFKVEDRKMRQLMKNLAGWPTVEREAQADGDLQADKKRQRWNTFATDQ